jgi:hypothetical protein
MPTYYQIIKAKRVYVTAATTPYKDLLEEIRRT